MGSLFRGYVILQYLLNSYSCIKVILLAVRCMTAECKLNVVVLVYIKTLLNHIDLWPNYSRLFVIINLNLKTFDYQ